MYKNIIRVIVSVLLLCLVFFAWLFFFKADLMIEGFEKEVVVPVFSEDIEPSFSICYGTLFKCDSIEMTPSLVVDYNKVGVYTVNYFYQYAGKNDVLTQVIRVVDEEKPVITIDSTVKVCPNGKILDGKYSALDNYDGDLTSNVKFLEETGKNYLEVSDSSGNRTLLSSDSINVSDDIAPTISLTGGKVYLVVGKKYSEPGFKASDSCDGDLTSKVTIKNNINNQKAGTYEVVYSVKDSSGNSKSVTRKVQVIKKNIVINPTNKTIYLTFDDGPSSYTGKLLKILDEYNVKATFFVTNQFPSYQKYIKEAYLAGHSIGVHTYSHNFSIYKSVDSYFNDLNKMNAIIKKQTGSESRIVRFPGGSSNTISRNYSRGIMKTLANELESRGYSYFDWNLGSGDTDGLNTSKQVSNRVIKNLNNQTRMVLMHDIKSYSVEAVRDIIEYGLSNGYNFQAININSPTFHHKINN